MFRRLQFTFPEETISIPCADQKLSTLQEMMDSYSTKFFERRAVKLTILAI